MSRQVISDGPSGAVPIPKDPRFQDLTGRRFGLQIVLSYAGKQNGKHRWNTRCDHGNLFVVNAGRLKAKIKKCRCQIVRHGYAASRSGKMPEYVTWTGAKQRCHNPNHRSYLRYGGRGITICQRWQTSFLNFLDDMGYRPTPAHTLDRIDNDGPYSPENCRWATRRDQARNRWKHRMITFNGEEHYLSEWAEIIGIRKSTLEQRFERGWTVEKAFMKPVNKRYSHSRMITHQGKTHCLAEWGEITGISWATIQGRLNRGWSTEKALTKPVLSWSRPKQGGK